MTLSRSPPDIGFTIHLSFLLSPLSDVHSPIVLSMLEATYRLVELSSAIKILPLR